MRKSGSSSNNIEKYGWNWNADVFYDPLDIELACIRKGGQWKTKGGTAGLGLFQHYKNAMLIAWASDDWHRWAEQFLVEALKRKYLGVVGPANANKTYMASKFALIDYWAFPNDTLTIVSSTDVRGLELRVWGTIKDLFNRTQERQEEEGYEPLPGVVLESLHTITTDRIDEHDKGKKARVLKKGIICVPCLSNGKYVGLGKYCFPIGEMIDTPMGQKPIETIKQGDIVLSAIGPNRVLKTMSKIAHSLVRIHLVDGRKIDCTPDHPILTCSGWVNASCILPNQRVFSAHETLQILRRGNAGFKTQVLQQAMSTSFMAETVQTMPSNIHSFRAESDFLFSILRSEMEDDSTGYCGENDFWQEFAENWEENKRRNNEEHCGQKAAFGDGFQIGCSEFSNSKSLWIESLLGIRNRPFSDTRRSVFKNKISRVKAEFHSTDWIVFKTGQKAKRLRNRLCVANDYVGCRTGRKLPQSKRSEGKGFNSGQVFEETRVEYIEVLKSSSDERFSLREGGYRVFNLSVEGHPSYSVNGVVVHNCGAKQTRTRLISDECSFMGPSFLDALSNLGQWSGFKFIGLGNAVDQLDCLGRICEPKDGWDRHPEPEKTTVWDTKWPDGGCLNFVGTDSPNFDYPDTEPVKYPYMVNRIGIADVEAFWGKDSLEYWSQCKGVFKAGLMRNRFWTPDFCKQHHAHDMATWESPDRIKIASLDAAYSGTGGDRCVFRWGEYGLAHDGKEILRVERPEIVPVSIRSNLSPEDQIAFWCQKRLVELGIPSDRLFYDATGRGSLGASFAKLMGNTPPSPIEFGGKPSKRPVRYDLFVEDETTGERRLKRCDEHYYDMVSELWFSLKYTVHAEQMRELDMDTVREGSLRETGVWSKKRNFVESKHNPKDRKKMVRSPDLVDNLVALVEGARRLGFKIANLSEGHAPITETNNWADDAHRSFTKTLRSHLLTHT